MQSQLINANCLEALPALPAGSVDMIMTDLPYGVTSRNTWDSIIPLVPLWNEFLRVTKETGAIVLTAIQPFSSLLVNSQPGIFKYEWIWTKSQGTGFLNAKKAPLRNHEQVLVFYRRQPVYNPQFTQGKPYSSKGSKVHSLNYGTQVKVATVSDGRRYPLDVQHWSHDKDKLHPTQKPVAMMEYFIQTYTNPGDMVLDCCMGSGTTPLAAQNTGRRFVGIEMDPVFFDKANRRVYANTAA